MSADWTVLVGVCWWRSCEVDSPMDGEPAEVLKNWGDVVTGLV